MERSSRIIKSLRSDAAEKRRRLFSARSRGLRKRSKHDFLRIQSIALGREIGFRTTVQAEAHHARLLDNCSPAFIKHFLDVRNVVSISGADNDHVEPVTSTSSLDGSIFVRRICTAVRHIYLGNGQAFRKNFTCVVIPANIDSVTVCALVLCGQSNNIAGCRCGYRQVDFGSDCRNNLRRHIRGGISSGHIHRARLAGNHQADSTANRHNIVSARNGKSKRARGSISRGIIGDRQCPKFARFRVLAERTNHQCKL